MRELSLRCLYRLLKRINFWKVTYCIVYSSLLPSQCRHNFVIEIRKHLVCQILFLCIKSIHANAHYDDTTAVLRNTIIGNLIESLLKVVNNFISCINEGLIYAFHNGIAIRCCTKQPYNIFKHKKLWFVMLNYLNVTLKKIVAIVISHSVSISHTTCK